MSLIRLPDTNSIHKKQQYFYTLLQQLFKMPKIWFLFRMVRLIDQEITVTEKLFCYSHFPTGEANYVTQSHMGKHLGQSGCRQSERKGWARTSVVFHRKEWERQGR